MHPPAMVRCCPDRLSAGLRVVGAGARSGPAPETRRWRSCSPTPGARSCATPQRTRMASRRRLRTPPAPRAAVAKALLGAALLAPAEGDEGRHSGLAWKLGGESVPLRTIEAGLQATGAAPVPAPQEPQPMGAAQVLRRGAWTNRDDRARQAPDTVARRVRPAAHLVRRHRRSAAGQRTRRGTAGGTARRPRCNRTARARAPFESPATCRSTAFACCCWPVRWRSPSCWRRPTAPWVSIRPGPALPFPPHSGRDPSGSGPAAHACHIAVGRAEGTRMMFGLMKGRLRAIRYRRRWGDLPPPPRPPPTQRRIWTGACGAGAAAAGPTGDRLSSVRPRRAFGCRPGCEPRDGQPATRSPRAR
jgi:hypothetical protein